MLSYIYKCLSPLSDGIQFISVKVCAPEDMFYISSQNFAKIIVPKIIQWNKGNYHGVVYGYVYKRNGIIIKLSMVMPRKQRIFSKYKGGDARIMCT